MLLHSKGNHQQNEKATHWVDDVCKWHIWHGTDIQNIQRAHKTQYKKPNQAERLHRHFAEEDIQTAGGHRGRFSASPTIREMPVETTARCYLTAVRVAWINRTRNNRCGRGGGEKAAPCPLEGMPTGAATTENDTEVLHKIKKTATLRSGSLLPGVYLRKMETLIQKDMRTSMLAAGLFTT